MPLEAAERTIGCQKKIKIADWKLKYDSNVNISLKNG